MKKRQNLLLCVATVFAAFLSSQAQAKTEKDCVAEWRADKAGMQARGVTEKSYVDQCKGGGAAPTAATPEPKPTVAAPTMAPKQTSGSAPKTAKDCTAEWRADKAGMQARGVTEKSYVDQCKGGGAPATTAAPEPKPTVAAPTPKQEAPAATQAAPAPQKPNPPTTSKPVAAPATQPTNTPASSSTLEAGQFANDAQAKARCPTDTVVWVNLSSKVYHFAGGKSYGTTKRGAYMCEKEAIGAENRASKNEKRP